MLREPCSLLNPRPQQFDLSRVQFLAVSLRGHPNVVVFGGDSAKQFAFVRLASHNGGLARFELCRQTVARVQSQPCLPFLFVRAMTLQATIRQDRSNVAIKVYRRVGSM